VPGGWVEDRDLLDTLLVDQSTQFSIDLARRQVLCVELRAVSVDFSDVRDLVVELDEAAGVEEDLRLAVRGRGGPRYRVQTITSPS
jgi:hypothetical protein